MLQTLFADSFCYTVSHYYMCSEFCQVFNVFAALLTSLLSCYYGNTIGFVGYWSCFSRRMWLSWHKACILSSVFLRIWDKVTWTETSWAHSVFSSFSSSSCPSSSVRSCRSSVRPHLRGCSGLWASLWRNTREIPQKMLFQFCRQIQIIILYGAEVKPKPETTSSGRCLRCFHTSERSTSILNLAANISLRSLRCLKLKWSRPAETCFTLDRPPRCPEEYLFKHSYFQVFWTNEPMKCLVILPGPPIFIKVTPPSSDMQWYWLLFQSSLSRLKSERLSTRFRQWKGSEDIFLFYLLKYKEELLRSFAHQMFRGCKFFFLHIDPFTG